MPFSSFKLCWFVFVDCFFRVGVVCLLRLRLLNLVGIISWRGIFDAPTFIERSEREAGPTDVHEVDNKRSSLGARQLRADDAQWTS